MSVVLTASDNADRAPQGLERQPALLHRHLIGLACVVVKNRTATRSQTSPNYFLTLLHLEDEPLFVNSQLSPPVP